MSILALEEHECTVYETKGDWWADSILGKQQLPGIFEVTNKRFAFRGKTLLGTAKENGLEFDLSDLASVEKCNIGNGIVKIICWRYWKTQSAKGRKIRGRSTQLG